MSNCRISAHQRTLVIKDNGYFFINIVNRGIDIGFTSFELCHVDSIGLFCAGGKISNLTSGFDNLGFLFRFTGSFVCDRISIFIENIIFYLTICTTYGNGGISGYPSSIVFVRLSMLLALGVIAFKPGFGRSDRI